LLKQTSARLRTVISSNPCDKKPSAFRKTPHHPSLPLANCNNFREFCILPSCMSTYFIFLFIFSPVGFFSRVSNALSKKMKRNSSRAENGQGLMSAPPREGTQSPAEECKRKKNKSIQGLVLHVSLGGSPNVHEHAADAGLDRTSRGISCREAPFSGPPTYI
jgi:hypothetical protein